MLIPNEKLIRLTIGERGPKDYYSIHKDTLCIMHKYTVGSTLSPPSKVMVVIITTTINTQREQLEDTKEVALCYV